MSDTEDSTSVMNTGDVVFLSLIELRSRDDVEVFHFIQEYFRLEQLVYGECNSALCESSHHISGVTACEFVRIFLALAKIIDLIGDHVVVVVGKYDRDVAGGGILVAELSAASKCQTVHGVHLFPTETVGIFSIGFTGSTTIVFIASRSHSVHQIDGPLAFLSDGVDGTVSTFQLVGVDRGVNESAVHTADVTESDVTGDPVVSALVRHVVVECLTPVRSIHIDVISFIGSKVGKVDQIALGSHTDAEVLVACKNVIIGFAGSKCSANSAFHTMESISN